ncbi:GPW/gp25 family protein [Paraburkholderia aspalathi]|uniref:GPW/gp25 family protein n=1 Tax=Paraburkholderia aspalathi TaxID=1324617 RepID=UPI0038B8BB8D
MADISDGQDGQGWVFPPRFTKDSGATLTGSARENVQQDMRVLFMTQPGERIMRPDYGCDVHWAMFRNISEDLTSGLQTQMSDSIQRYMPQVALESVTVAPDAGQLTQLDVTVVYRQSGTQGVQRVSGSVDVMNGLGINGLGGRF